MAFRVSCPYCNTVLTLASKPTDRVTCVRCQESFSPSVGDLTEIDDQVDSAHASGQPLWTSETAEPQSHWPLAVFAGTIGMIVVGLGLWAILRVPPRADTESSSPVVAKKVSTFPPSVLPTLKYLPPDTNIAFSLQLRPMQEYAERNNTDLRSLLLKTGVTEKLLTTLSDKGFRLEELDLITGGLAIVGDALLPRFVLVVQFTAEPVDRSGLLKNLKATQFTAPSGATRYKVDLGGIPTELQIVGERAYVFATSTPDLDSGVKRDNGSGHLPTGLRDSLRQLSPSSLAWIATEPEDWSKKPIIKVAASLSKQADLAKQLEGIRAIAAGVSLEPVLQLSLNLKSPEPEGGAKLRDRLAGQLAGKTDELAFGAFGPWAILELPLKDKAEGLSLLELLSGK